MRTPRTKFRPPVMHPRNRFKNMSTLNLDQPARIGQPRSREAVQALEAQLAALRETDRRKDKFLAMLAHELRNPLASVTNAVAVLRTAEGPEERAWATDLIARQTGQLTRLIDDLLDMARIGSGKIFLRKETLDLARALDAEMLPPCSSTNSLTTVSPMPSPPSEEVSERFSCA